jgi:hypothetical protein
MTNRTECGQKQTWPLNTIPVSAWWDWVKPHKFWSRYPVSHQNSNPERLKYKAQIHKIRFYVFRHIPQYVYNHILLITLAYFSYFRNENTIKVRYVKYYQVSGLYPFSIIPNITLGLRKRPSFWDTLSCSEYQRVDEAHKPRNIDTNKPIKCSTA